MIGLNEVSLLGHLGDEPKISETKSGIKTARFALATSETWYDKESGDKRQKTEWHRIIVWRELASVVEQYCHKGSRILIKGKLETTDYTDSEGVRRWVTSVVADKIILLDRFANADTEKNSQEATTQQQIEQNAAVVHDEIPF